MNTPDRSNGCRRHESGFSMLELLVVIGIILLTAAVALPNLRGYLRTSAIRAAASQVASELNTARARAIGKNLHFGTVFVVLSTTTYQFVTEDDVDRTNGYTGTRLAVSTALADSSQHSSLKTLPNGVVFQTASANNTGIRFSAFGVACNPTSGTTCPALDTGVNQIAFTSDFRITLYQASTGLYKSISIGPGGRIFINEGYTQ